MPRPPVLPPVDYKSIWEKGKSYPQWLAAAESADNAAKMERIRGELTLTESQRAWLGAIPRIVHVIAFAEDWCGDVHRFVPALEALAGVSMKLLVRYVSREEAPEAFKRFLTNGGEAVPKFVFFNENFVECGNWGPMPDACRKLIARGKAAGDVGAARKKTTAICDADAQSHTAIRELMDLIETASCTAP
ncbi:hypothetical protein BH09SUM1_BH09SUM1_34500 [soil metagenome]